MSTRPAKPADPLATPARSRLLVVDDQPINIQVLNQIFQADHDVFMATSGIQTLEICAHNPPDLILLDVVMPDMDGLEVCRRLKADPATADIPVIFVTAQSSPDEETQALDAGGVDFISKPVTPAVVRARVKTHLTLKAQGDLLRSLVFIDGLTGVANRRHFDDALTDEWRRCRRNGVPLALILIDIDYFKRYNDYYGHQAGDICLQAVASSLKAAFGRSHDLIARYGGEEFVCLMPESNRAGARAKAEALRKRVEQLAIPHADSPGSPFVTLSLGVAVLIPDDQAAPADLVRSADLALYAAKQDGRNRVCETGL